MSRALDQLRAAEACRLDPPPSPHDRRCGVNAANLANMPAFPVPPPKGKFPPDECLAIIERSRGVTLRQHYAGLALQGYIAAGSTGMPDAYRLAELAAAAADALITELAKPVKP